MKGVATYLTENPDRGGGHETDWLRNKCRRRATLLTELTQRTDTRRIGSEKRVAVANYLIGNRCKCHEEIATEKGEKKRAEKAAKYYITDKFQKITQKALQ